MRLQVIFGILLIFTQAATGLLFQDAVVCRFIESNECYVALGQQLHLQVPLGDGLNVKITDKTSTTRSILRYRNQYRKSLNLYPPRWQFVKERTLILTSAERNDSGTYTLEVYDFNGRNKGIYTLQLDIEDSLFQGPVVCIFTESNQCYVALGQQLHLQMPLEDGFNLVMTDKTSTDRFIFKYRENRSNAPKPNFPRWQFVKERTLILTSAERNDSGLYTLDVYDLDGRNKGIYALQLNIEEPTTLAPTIGQFTVVSSSTQCNHDFMVFVTVWLFEVIILLSLLVGAFCFYTRTYRKQRITGDQEQL